MRYWIATVQIKFHVLKAHSRMRVWCVSLHARCVCVWHKLLLALSFCKCFNKKPFFLFVNFCLCRISTPLPNLSSLNLRGDLFKSLFPTQNIQLYFNDLWQMFFLRCNSWLQIPTWNHNNQESSHQDHRDQGRSGKVTFKSLLIGLIDLSFLII